MNKPQDLNKITATKSSMKIEYTQSNILPPFPTQKSCQAYIDNNLDDLKLLFGVE